MRNTRPNFAGLLCLFYLGLGGTALATDNDGHFVSDQGLHRYENLELSWSALTGRHTHEVIEAGELLLVGSSDGLHALDRQGRRLWQLQAGGTVFPPLTDGERIWAGSESGRLHALSRDSGELLWQRDFPGWVYSPARSGDTLASGGSHGRLWALDAASGADRWSLDLGAELVYSPPADTDNFYATTFAAELLAIDAASGAVRWRRQLPAAAGAAQLADGRLLLRLFDGSLLALASKDGSPLWHHRTHARASSPATLLSSERLLLDEGGGLLSLLSARDGQLLARAHYRGELVGRPLWREDATLIHLRSLPGSAPIALRLSLQPRLVFLEE